MRWQRRLGAAERRPRRNPGPGTGRRRRSSSSSAVTARCSTKTRARHRAYALRSALLEPGTARVSRRPSPLAGAQLPRLPRRGDVLEGADGEPDLRRCRRQHFLAGVRADTETRAEGHEWSGRLPVPGTGAYEWDGFRRDLPREINPPRGFIATANNNIQPPGFTPPVFFKTSTNVEFDRITRLLQMIQPGRNSRSTITAGCSSTRSRCARAPRFRCSAAGRRTTPDVERARALIAPGTVCSRVTAPPRRCTPPGGRRRPSRNDGSRPAAERRPLHEASLARAIQELTRTQGADFRRGAGAACTPAPFRIRS